MQTDYELLLLISFTVQGEILILVHSLQLLTFWGCVGSIQRQKLSGWVVTYLKPQLLWHRTSPQWLSGTQGRENLLSGEVCQGFQEVLAMHPVPRIDFGSELIGNSLVAHRDEGSTPILSVWDPEGWWHQAVTSGRARTEAASSLFSIAGSLARNYKQHHCDHGCFPLSADSFGTGSCSPASHLGWKFAPHPSSNIPSC